MRMVLALMLAAGSGADRPARAETSSDCPEHWHYICVDGFSGDGKPFGFCACQPPANWPPADTAPGARP